MFRFEDNDKVFTIFMICVKLFSVMFTAKNVTKHLISSFCLLSSFTFLFVSHTNAAPNSNFTQTINAGTLTTDIRDGSRVTVGSPAVAMGAKTFSFDCQSGGSASTGTFGTVTERIYVDNPDGADNGWTLTVAGSATTALWTSGGNTFDFNDAGGSGCTDGADVDSKGGQMTVDASVSTLTTDCASCATSNITKGSSSAFVQGTTDTITLLTAANTSDDIWRGYLTGVGISQTIPAEQPAANNYTVNLVLTATAQ